LKLLVSVQPGIVYFLGKMWLFKYDTGIVDALLINILFCPLKTVENNYPSSMTMLVNKRIHSGRRAP